MRETERFVRDLIWAVNSPPLMDLTCPGDFVSQPLNVEDIDGEHLKNHLTGQREKRVGRYFERLIFYWIRHIRRCEIVAQSLQLFEGNRTIGEVDLLFRDEQGRVNHWEVACKFYLQVDSGNACCPQYIGPNPADTLQGKATRLLNHQLPIGARYFPETEVQVAFVKGRIFYHKRTGRRSALPIELARDHQEGSWIRAREVPEFVRTGPGCYRILRKPFWLAEELADSHEEDLLNAEEVIVAIQKHFRSRQTPILLSVFADAPSAAAETERCFIVPDDWPGTDTQRCRGG